MSEADISPALGSADIEEVRALFQAYAASLPVDLGYQDFDAELAGLPGKYGPPRGALLLARGQDGDALGCVALRPLADVGRCEMKRLFIRPGARGRRLGARLAQAAIAQAEKLGYAELWLDTLPTMASAISLYEGLGFERRPPYYAPTPEGTIFMALQLGPPKE